MHDALKLREEQRPAYLQAPLASRKRHADVWVALVLQLGILLLLNRFADFFVAGNASRFVPLVLAAGVCYWVAVTRFEFVAPYLRSPVLWGAAIGLRLAVFFMPPADDLWRYLWEGNIQLHAFNPYTLAPNAPELASLREPWWQFINHKDYAAIYPPGVEWVFYHLAGLATACKVPSEHWPLVFKAVFALADLATVGLLLKLNTGSGRYHTTAWYAWNPAVITAFTGAGHYDSLLLLFMTLSVLLLHRANPLGLCKPEWGWGFLSAVFLGCAISVKTIPLLLLPVWAFALGKRFALLAVAVLIPLFSTLAYGGLETVTASFRQFTSVTRFNDLVWWAVERSFWPNPAQQNLRYTLFLGATVLVLAWVFRRDWRKGALWVMGAALILSPVLHPWYVTWVLPFATWRKSQGWFLFAILVNLAFLEWDDTVFGPAWGEVSPALRLLMTGPVLAWLAWTQWKRHTTQKAAEAPSTA